MGVTREDVAKLAGVSGTTVSYVMNNTKNISPEVCRRVWDAAKQLNYHPSLLARGLATNETKHIAIIIKNLQNPYYNAIQEGVQMIAAQEGYIVSVLSAHESPLDNMNIMLSRGIDGNDITVEQSGYDAADALLRRGVPFTGVFAVNDRMTIGAMLMYQLLEKLHPDRSFPLSKQPFQAEFM